MKRLFLGSSILATVCLALALRALAQNLFVNIRTSGATPSTSVIAPPAGCAYSAAAPVPGTTWNNVGLSGAINLASGWHNVEIRFGNGTGGSRSITATGQAIVESAALVVEKGRKAAAHLMEAAEGDIEFANGRFTIAGTDRNIGIMELAQRLREGKVPAGVPSSLDVDHATKDTPSTFPNGCHVAEVEIDPETGVTRIVRYTGISDFGTIVNPMIVAGQLHGGVAQGIGQALMEEVSYDTSGQPITGSFMDYAMPRAGDIPLMETGDHPSPAKSNPLGTKGCGEAGCAGSLVCIVNAVLDALSEYGIKEIDMPLTPERVWRAIQDAKTKAA